MQKDLDEHAQFKRKLGLYDMDLTSLSIFYCTNTEQNIGKKIAILKAINCNEQIEMHLAKTNSDLTEAKRYETNELLIYFEFNLIELPIFVFLVSAIVFVMSTSVMETLIDCYVIPIVKSRDSLKKR